MKKLIIILALPFLMAGGAEKNRLSDKEYYHQIVKELSSDQYYGRSNYMDGDVKAAKYIIGELKAL